MTKKTKQNRRDILKIGLASSAALLLASCRKEPVADDCPSRILKKRELRVVTSWQKNATAVGTSIERLAKAIEQVSDGSLRFKIYASGELVPPLQVLDAVSSGAADAYHSVDYYFQSKSVLLNFFTGVPFGMLPREHLAWLQHMGGQKRWEKIMEPFNIHPMPCGASGIQMLGWFKKPLHDLDSIKGLKIRTTGLSLAIWEQLGAAPVLIPGSDIYFALRSGKVDAVKWIAPWNDVAMSLHKVAPYYYYPGITPTGMINLGINLEVWNDLSKYHQNVITTCTQEEYVRFEVEMLERNAFYLRYLKTKTDVKFMKAPQVIMDAIKKEAAKTVLSSVQNVSGGEELYRDYMTSLSLLRQWNAVSEEPFLQFS